MQDVYDEIDHALRAHYERTSYEMPSSTELRQLWAKQEIRNRKNARCALQPWLGLLEFGLEWLSYVHIALDEELDRNAGQDNDSRLVVACALAGAAVPFGLSLRMLCISGFDTPARALLRSYVESLLLCLAALHDKNLARSYQQAQEESDVKAFWHTAASPKSLHKRIIKIEDEMKFGPKIIDELTDYRRQEYDMLSQSSHLSYIAAWLTVRSPEIGTDNVLKRAIWGLVSSNSERTLFYAVFSTVYFSWLAYNRLLGWSRSTSLIDADKENDWHRRIVMGRDVLGTIWLNHYPSSEMQSPSPNW